MCWALLAGCLSAAAPAGAQQVDPQALGAAQAIFESAEQLMAADRFDEACPKLEEVVRLVPAGVGAKMTLARCYEGAGRLASAWAAYLIAGNAAMAAGQADRAKTAAERAAALKPRLSTLTISVPESLRALPGLAVQRGGKGLSQAEWGLAVPIDPGTHAVEVSAAGKKPWRGSAEVKAEADAATIALPARLDDAAPEVSPPLPVKETAPVKETTPRPPDTVPGARGGVPAWAWAVGGVGVALAGVGVGFAVDQRAVQANIDAACSGGTSCTAGFDAHGANARLYRDFGVFVGAGLAGVAAITAGVVGIAVAPGRTQGEAPAIPRAWVGPGAAGLGVAGELLMARGHLVSALVLQATLLTGCPRPAPRRGDDPATSADRPASTPRPTRRIAAPAATTARGAAASRGRASPSSWSPAPGIPGFSSFGGLTLDAERVYWTDTTYGVASLPLAGGTPSQLVAYSGSTTTYGAVAVSTDTAYMTPGSVVDTPKAGQMMTPQTLVTAQAACGVAVNT